jgi:hypothetical protein
MELSKGRGHSLSSNYSPSNVVIIRQVMQSSFEPRAQIAPRLELGPIPARRIGPRAPRLLLCAFLLQPLRPKG